MIQRRCQPKLAVRLVTLVGSALFATSLLGGTEACSPTVHRKAMTLPSLQAERCRVDETFDMMCQIKTDAVCAGSLPAGPAQVWGEKGVALHDPRFDPEMTSYHEERYARSVAGTYRAGAEVPYKWCCYSGCSPLKNVDASPANVAAPPGKSLSSFCVPTPPAGVSRPAAEPYDDCPVAIAPPDDLANQTARFSSDTTKDRRNYFASLPGYAPGRELLACCYGYVWQSSTRPPTPPPQPGRPLIIASHPRVASLVSQSWLS